MTIAKTAGAPAIFLSIPYVNSFADTAGQIVATSMQALVHRIYQMDPTAYWQGALGASDSNTEVIVMGLYSGSAQIAVSLDSFILLNHNLNNFLLEYCTDYVPGVGGAAGTGTWQTIENVTGQAGVDYQNFLASPIAAVNGLRLTMYTTGPTANQEKKLGNFIAALATFQLSKPPTRFTARPSQNVKEVELADKTKDRTFFYWSDNSFTLNDLSFDHSLMPAADKDNLDALFAAPDPFLCYPEPGDVPRALYLCNLDPNSYDPIYYGQWKGAGYNLPFKLRQAGYV